MNTFEEQMMEKAKGIARNMFDAGAREVALMAAEGELDTLTFVEVVNRARERAIHRTPEIETVLRG